MEKILVFLNLLYLVPALTVSAQSDSTGYLIKGMINGVDTGTVYLHDDNSGRNINSARLDSGRFILSGKLTEPVKCTMAFNFNYDALPIFLENTKYVVAIQNTPFDYTITGGRLQQQFMEYANIITGYFEGWDKIKRILAKESLWNDKENSQKIRDALDSTVSFLEEEIINKSLIFIKKNTDSYIAPRVISNILLLNKSYVSVANSYYEMLDKKIKFSSEGKYLKNWIDELESSPKIGDSLKSFKAKNKKNNEVFFLGPGKGKLVLLNFWASWCGPCIKEFPAMTKLYNKFKDKGFEIINISIDTDKQRWLKYITSTKLPWPQWIDAFHTDSSIARLFKIRSIPASYLIDENMKIIGIDLQENQLEEELIKLLKPLRKEIKRD